MTEQQIDVIFTPPPTPNGGLHVGHVAGPYLRADLNRRLLGYHCRKLHVTEARQAATELRTKYERFLERIGSPQLV